MYLAGLRPAVNNVNVTKTSGLVKMFVENHKAFLEQNNISYFPHKNGIIIISYRKYPKWEDKGGCSGANTFFAIKNMRKKLITANGKKLALGMILFITLIHNGGCSRKMVGTVERCVRDTIHEVRYRTDSIIERDSIIIEAKGDTVLKKVYKCRDRIRHSVDTVIKTRVDSVPVLIKTKSNPEPRNKKESSVYSEIKRIAGSVLSFTGAFTLIILLSRAIRKIRR